MVLVRRKSYNVIINDILSSVKSCDLKSCCSKSLTIVCPIIVREFRFIDKLSSILEINVSADEAIRSLNREIPFGYHRHQNEAREVDLRYFCVL